MTTHNTLYRLWNANWELLYVGITIRGIAERAGQHRAEKNWWDEVWAITLETYSNTIELKAAEKRAIRKEHPRYNIVHNHPARAGTPTLEVRPSHYDRKPTRFELCVCGKESTYVPRTDRFYHLDGTDNLNCWVAVTSGKANPDSKVAADWDEYGWQYERHPGGCGPCPVCRRLSIMRYPNDGGDYGFVHVADGTPAFYPHCAA